MTRSGCRLSWEPSKDDGGLPFEYIVEKFMLQGDTWSQAGRTTNTFFELNDLEWGREYDFRVTALNPVGESESLMAMKPVTAKDNFSKKKVFISSSA